MLSLLILTGQCEEWQRNCKLSDHQPISCTFWRRKSKNCNAASLKLVATIHAPVAAGTSSKSATAYYCSPVTIWGDHKGRPYISSLQPFPPCLLVQLARVDLDH